MRKYHQLLLLIVSAMSLSLLLVYRHEYNRLHYVLEVFNFFGQPCNLSDLVESDNLVNHHDWGLTPVWTEDDNFHVYSSFWVPTNEAKALVLRYSKFEHAKYCYLWYEDRDEAVIGKFRCSQLTKDDEDVLGAYYYVCTGSKTVVPYAASFTRSKTRKMKRHLLTVGRNRVTFNMTLCVAAVGDTTKRELVEFMSLHSLIGVDSFVVYSDSIPYRLMKTIINLTSRLSLKVTFFPWNFPYADSKLARLFIEQDCLVRTVRQSKFVATLTTDEYLVPTAHLTLNEALVPFGGGSDRLTVPVQKFCVSHTDSEIPIALQNLKMTYDEEKPVRTIFKNDNDSGVAMPQGIDKDFISVHKYMRCAGEAFKTYEDNGMLKFSNDFRRSTLFQLMLHKQL